MISPADGINFRRPTEMEAKLRARIRELEEEVDSLHERNKRLRRSFARRITIELLK